MMPKMQNTSHCFLGPLLRYYLQVFERDDHSFDVAKQSRDSQAEEHDKEEDGPGWGSRHLGDGFCKDDEGQTRSLHPLRQVGRE